RDPPPANIMAQQEPNGGFPYLPSGAAEGKRSLFCMRVFYITMKYRFVVTVSDADLFFFSVNRMIKDDLFSDSQCKVCSAVLISESQKLAHYQSKKHESKVRRYMSIHGNEEPIAKRFKPSDLLNIGDKYKVCSVCNMTFSSPVVAQSHYQGKVHSKNLLQVKKNDVLPEGGQGGDPDRFCSICQASFNNPLMAQQHYSGKKHKKHLTKQKLMETYGPSSAPASTLKGYPCTVCNIELNSVEQYQAHISGSKHKNQTRECGGLEQLQLGL
uniref:Zinc finger protein 346 n=1 Tax=Cyprinus carpio TaxID=7962 RepID=A0A8C2JX81_CYPCA